MSRAGGPQFRAAPVSVAVVRAASVLAPTGEVWRTIQVSRREFVIVVPAAGDDPDG
ncbi:hypothetical protein ACIA5G_30390 [Amycolatopsis sp. NPDC051758]|uniref:hypothetical protein n=1 Tax=Amycolatopsis sp. NPDC051758 TaxID=3363935 RepID=UPI00379C0081